jgi:ZIP family zinc transporter
LNVVEQLSRLHPVVQALLGGLFTWALTALGAALVVLTTRLGRRLFDGMLGFAGGVMLAASYWSLLAPALEIAREQGSPPWLPAAAGFLLGTAAMWGLDHSLPHLHPGFSRDRAEGPRTGWQRAVLLVLAITLHNIPEGLAVGVAFAGASAGLSSSTLGAAVALTLGIAIQNIPEGTAVAMPLRGEGVSRLKSFWYGQLSAAVEPVAAVAGAATVLLAARLLPYALSFAAGAMIYVVVEELIPEAGRQGNIDLATVCLAAGFTVMMVLDVTLG